MLTADQVLDCPAQKRGELWVFVNQVCPAIIVEGFC